MNVIISNKKAEMLSQLTIEVIKSEQGVFSVDEIIAKYQNFFYQRMILDITALKDYTDIKTLQKLSISLDMDKLILLLDDTEATSAPTFLSQLISIGIYNFTKNVEGIMYLYNNPNTYRDVAQYHHINEPQAAPVMAAMPVGNGEGMVASRGVRIIGFKSVTPGCGATSLIYMMKNQLAQHYKVVAIEVDKSDFTYYRDSELVSTTNDALTTVVSKYNNLDAILIDMNNSATANTVVHDIIYLMEPSTIKLNRLMTLNPDTLENLKNKKVVLNKSMLSQKDIMDFEYESKLKVFFNLPPLDERERNNAVLNQFLAKLGFVAQDDGSSASGEKKNKLFGLFNI